MDEHKSHQQKNFSRKFLKWKSSRKWKIKFSIKQPKKTSRYTKISLSILLTLFSIQQKDFQIEKYKIFLASVDFYIFLQIMGFLSGVCGVGTRISNILSIIWREWEDKFFLHWGNFKLENSINFCTNAVIEYIKYRNIYRIKFNFIFYEIFFQFMVKFLFM